ncbi:dentin sialophosphoprotein-like [Maniola jurtina]|uniref:dentin sialophosphoprotein-like n=1 Tax=Maniola jurtina TaxID=191418 RepID=UPI001E68D949|nr:dentin sialophosphoprotein-like [Maniola jurtina]
MQFFIVLLLLGSCVMLSRGRPARLEDTNDSETAEVEYEGNDDTAAEDYLREDQEPTMEEAQQKYGRREDVEQESQEEGDARDSEDASDQQPAQDKYSYDSLSDNNSGSRKERERHGITNFNTESERDYISERERSRKSQQFDEAGNAPNNFYSRSHNNRPLKDLSINGRPVDTNPEYGDMLFKMKPAVTSRQQNGLAEEAGEQSRTQQYYNNMHSKSRVQESENTMNYDRDRRHAQSVEDKQTDSTRTPDDKQEADITNENSEIDIIRNIKKLSEQDLEELLNSLPDDKKALLMKIMDKREITKKAGAVDESSYLEGGQPDTSKLEGGYSVDSNTESSMTTTDTSKQTENSDNLSSKSPDNENDSRGSGSKSEIINNTDVKNSEPAIRIESESSNTDSKNDVNINSDAEQISKNEKRETNYKDLTNEKMSSEDSQISDNQFDDISVNQDDQCSENEDWIDTRLNEPIESNDRSGTSKREIFQSEPLANQDCVKSLEESFPAANSYEDNNLESEMAPLIRVKRTEKDHHIKKRNSLLPSDAKVHYAPRVESEDNENEEKGEFEDYGMLDRATNFIRNGQEGKLNKDTVSANSNIQNRYLQCDKSDSELRPCGVSHKKDKLSLGSDTDNVLSGIEGVDDNLMYNSGSRGKRTLKSSNDNTGKINLNRNGRTVGPMNDAVTDNSINASQYQDDEAFGSLTNNSEEDVSRFKRVRQVKDSQK